VTINHSNSYFQQNKRKFDNYQLAEHVQKQLSCR